MKTLYYFLGGLLIGALIAALTFFNNAPALGRIPSPTELTLIIPDLENLMPFVQEDPSFDLFDLYPGLSKRQAYHTCLE